MQAELEVKKTGKPQSFYQRHIRPALRRLWNGQQESVWDVEVDDGAPDEENFLHERASLVTTVIILGLAQAILFLLPIAYIVQLVFVEPGGLSAIIGHQLAEVCRGGGSCDIHQLLASYAFAVIFLVNAIGLFAFSIFAGAGVFDKPGHPSDLPFAVAVVDEHVVTLHEELIAAKVLPEPAEPDDDN